MPHSRPFGGAATRRCFICGTIGAAAAVTTATLSGPTLAAIAPGREKMREFPYGAVRLTDGPIKDQFDHIHAHYLALDNDRVLKVFREHAGLPAPGRDMGGWYDKTGFVPGLTLGQYISGLARLGAATNDPACHAKVAALVKGFGEVLRATDNPYPGPNAEKMWPAYVMDKYIVGLVDAYRLSGVEEAKTLLPVVVDKCLPFISPVSKDRIGKKEPPYDETYVLSENLFHVADITGDAKYRALAVHYLLNKEWFDPLAAGQDVLPTKHAYSHTIALSSGGQAYLQLGDDKYKKALINAWTYMEPQRFASGGWGPEEQFVEHGKGALAASLQNSTAHFETPCGAFADLKLARYLIRLTGEPVYGDGLERTLYNTMLATRRPDSDGDYPYYSNYGARADKQYYKKKWPCCSGTLVQGVADYVLNVYFHDDEALLVNMFVPSTVSWARPGGEVQLEQVTTYPAGDTTRLRVVRAGNGRFAVKLRIPAWTKGAKLTVNGVSVATTPGQLATISRTWKAGDVIDLSLPQPVRTVAIDPENPNLRAVMRGPVLYAGLNPWEGLESETFALPQALKPVAGQADALTLNSHGRDLVFVPYYRIDTETYHTYFRTA
ncbi:glycoside hydrolase family 127 protein [Asticcacaulis sp. BYS171W]|uniref:Glycoside hydrolase family 127 protein n=1 Tax=Asticcacaulis aquaticus TaxID=2984212 RepID=A0ABT5HVS2_9CAUL|nr:beta-L-arabinofuranosidase domain-containing protein [Asticcacaulis aquaticus]MDC7684175.1 glycoside hydrolase family 127 protein [Asticcacaulis aquaticus]